ncbi:MAG: hypothetical protein JXA10_01220 [Anaerolineae bacterium]|nr:hypothetical protein [Anaerolineae bacterium]
MSDNGLITLLQTQLARYPQSEVADIYKLLHQATFGPGHLIDNKRAAREFLEQECDQLTPSTEAALVENIHPTGAIVRVHLRPYLALGARLNWLLDAFVRAAKQVAGDPAVMAARWQQFESYCETACTSGNAKNNSTGNVTNKAQAPSLSLREAQLFGKFRAAEGWPAVHHSPTYATAYQPKYRVLTCKEAEALCARLKVPFAPI